MELIQLFGKEMVNQGISLYLDNKVIIIDEDTHTVKGLVFDKYYYLVTLTFNKDYSIVYPSVSKDGIKDKNPFNKPYASALMFNLFLEDKYDITCKCKLDQLKKPKLQTDFFADQLIDLKCYKDTIEILSNHILRIQNYNTDKRLCLFSQSIDDVFEFFDSLTSFRKRIISIQTFIHLYAQLSFNFSNQDIHYVIIDECNQRINETLNEMDNPFHKLFYQTLLLNDTHIHPYLCDYNKVINQSNNSH